jgi:hypothetical protein
MPCFDLLSFSLGESQELIVGWPAVRFGVLQVVLKGLYPLHLFTNASALGRVLCRRGAA